jgi:hypothetical protein
MSCPTKALPKIVSDLFDCYVSSMLNECWIATLSRSKIALCAHFECDVCITCRYDYFADDTYEISQESAEDISEGQVNVTKGLSEAPNQSSEDNNTNIPNSSPTSKGKPWCMTQYFNLLQFYIYILYLALSLGIEMKS